MLCIKSVVNVKCQYCLGLTIRFRIIDNKQRYRCKDCKRTQLKDYINHACKAGINPAIAAHVKEGCGIRSISRLLHIATGTVIYRIKKIADGDKVAGDKPEKGSKGAKTLKNPDQSKGHPIMDFQNMIDLIPALEKLPAGKYKIVDGKIVPDTN